jgi:hypothetical protein
VNEQCSFNRKNQIINSTKGEVNQSIFFDIHCIRPTIKVRGAAGKEEILKERRGCGGEKEVVGKTPGASKVVNGERDEDDLLVVEAGDDLGPVRGLELLVNP